jgi:hypothetical protein
VRLLTRSRQLFTHRSGWATTQNVARKCHLDDSHFTIRESTREKPQGLMNGPRKTRSRSIGNGCKGEAPENIGVIVVRDPGFELGWEAGSLTNRLSSVRRRSRSFAKPFRFCQFADRCLFIGLLPFADCCGFYRGDVTQNVTRRRCLLTSSCRSARRSPLLTLRRLSRVIVIPKRWKRRLKAIVRDQ